MKLYRYDIKINGTLFIVYYEPQKFENTIHIVFEGVEGEKNPISDTGYKSHFIIGTPESLGITENNIEHYLKELGEGLAKEEQARRLKEKRRRKLKKQ